jgi:hypothetical protein
MKKPSSKVGHNLPPIFFQYYPELPIRPKIENPYRNLYSSNNMEDYKKPYHLLSDPDLKLRDALRYIYSSHISW